MATKKITLNELKLVINHILNENEQEDVINAEKYVNLMVKNYGNDYKTLHKAILYNLVNSKYNRISNDFVLNVWSELDKKFNSPSVNEDYPTGASEDPNAPWNQTTPDYEDYDVVKNGDNINNFGVQLINSAGGKTNIIYLSTILDNLNSSPEEYQYFEYALQQTPRPPSFIKKLNILIDEYSDKVEYGDNSSKDDFIKYNPDEY